LDDAIGKRFRRDRSGGAGSFGLTMTFIVEEEKQAIVFDGSANRTA
jgi:hypothetical protein